MQKIVVGLLLFAGAMPKSWATTYVAIGDSITSGTHAENKAMHGYHFSWATGDQLDANFARQIHADEAYNVSFPGMVSDGLWIDQVNKAEEKRANIVSVLIGANDVCWGLGHRVFGNVEKIVDRLSQNDSVETILVGTLPDLEQVYQVGKSRSYCAIFTNIMCPNYFLRSVEERAKIRQQVKDINKEIAKLPDAFPKVKAVVAIGEQEYGPDDISKVDCFHPTKKAQQRIADAFFEVYNR
jgi:lysophospholipase L1-like esterase